jgi:thioredoxin
MKKIIPRVLFLFLLTACGVSQQSVQALPTDTPNHPLVATSATATKQPKPTPVPSLTATEAVFPTQETLIDTPIDGTDALFNKLVLQSPQPVIVDFWAGWCTECKPMADTLKIIAKEYAGRVIVIKMNIDLYPDRARWYGANALPAVDFFVNGSLAYRAVGAMNEGMVRTLISNVFGIRWISN